MQNNGNFSLVRFIIGMVVFVGICAFVASAVGFNFFDMNSMIFVLGSALACCVIACSNQCWSAAFNCFSGKTNCNVADANCFWSNFGTFAWYSGMIGAFMFGVAYIGDVSKWSGVAKVMEPMMYCLCYGMMFRAIGYAIACGVSGSVVNSVGDNSMVVNDGKTNVSKKSNERVAVEV